MRSLLVQWERRTSESTELHDIHPDFGALRRILNLPLSTNLWRSEFRSPTLEPRIDQTSAQFFEVLGSPCD
jgi:hypothetical protein